MGYPTKTSALETFYCGGGRLIHNFNLVDETKINYLVIPPPMQHHNVLRDIPPPHLLFINRQHLSNFQANDSQQSKMTVFPYFLLRQLPNTLWHYVIGFSPKKSKMTPNPCLILLGWTTSSPHFMSSSPLPPPPPPSKPLAMASVTCNRRAAVWR